MNRRKVGSLGYDMIPRYGLNDIHCILVPNIFTSLLVFKGAGRGAEAWGSELCVFICSPPARAPQINLGRPESYQVSGRLVIVLLQGCTRVMNLQKKQPNIAMGSVVVSHIIQDALATVAG